MAAIMHRYKVLLKIRLTHSEIDVLINNAQASKPGVLFADHSVEDFNLAIHSGLYAAFYYMKECFPYLKQSKQPRVINFASSAGVYGNIGQTSCSCAGIGYVTRSSTRMGRVRNHS